jgi:hypothetical protein
MKSEYTICLRESYFGKINTLAGPARQDETLRYLFFKYRPIRVTVSSEVVYLQSPFWKRSVSSQSLHVGVGDQLYDSDQN